jgi:hypothetical protein
VSGDTWNVRMARSEEDMTMLLHVSLSKFWRDRAHCPVESNAICLMVELAILSR